MGPLTLVSDSGKSRGISSGGFSDSYKSELHKSSVEVRKPFAAVAMTEQKPFDFLRLFCDGVVAGGTAGVVVEALLYPIDTIKTRLQAGRSGWKQNLLERSLFWTSW